ncbi:striatin-3-like, partial [Seriola lalandi dorsalis]|uniref:striatin-3-like n=1 Tax=Seriola lalandi dorsalis TaxID=1841481 RepID=UPI000C6FAFE0
CVASLSVLCVRPPDTKDSEVSAVPANSQLTWKQGRQLLRQYLQEVGYTDTILDVRTQRVRSLLGLSGSEQNGSVENKNLQHLINGTERRKDSKRSPGDVLETFNFLENAEDSDEDEDEEGDLMDDISTDKHHRAKKHKTKVGNEGLASEDDADTEEALKEFDFLVTGEDGEGAGEARSSGDGTEWELKCMCSISVRSHQRELVTDHRMFLCVDSLDFRGKSRLLAADSASVMKMIMFYFHCFCRSASFDVEPIYTFRAHVGPVLSLAMTSSGEQCFSGGIDSTIQWWNIPSSNVDPYDTYEPPLIHLFDLSCLCAGKVIHAMVAHLDAVTSLAVDPNGIYLMSGSHDCSLRLWNLDSKTCVQEITAHRKKSEEAIYDVAFHPSKAYIASAGADALARVYV